MTVTHFDAFDPRYGRIGRHGAALIMHAGLKYPRGDYRRENAEAILADCPELVHVDVKDLCTCTVGEACVCTRDYTPTPEEERNDDTMSDNYVTDAEIEAAHQRFDAKDGKGPDPETAHARMVADAHRAYLGESSSARNDAGDEHDDDRTDAGDDPSEQARARMLAEVYGESGGRAPRLDAASAPSPAGGGAARSQHSDPRHPTETITRSSWGIGIDMGIIGSGSGL